MPAVDSSAILRIRYQPQGETLLVTFITGKTYAYDGVPAPIYDAFLAADFVRPVLQRPHPRPLFVPRRTRLTIT
jgi:hypothetical protein